MATTATPFSTAAAAGSSSKGSSKKDSSSGAPWVERYRPKNLDEVSHQSEVVRTLQSATTTGKLPHLLLYGPPGTGKTSVALALCRQLWDPSQYNWRRRVLELNASDERGISIVRDKIKHFASLQMGSSGSSSTLKPPKGTKSVKSFFKTKSGSSTSSKGESSSKTTETDGAATTTTTDDKEAEGKVVNYPNPPFKIIILDEADTVSSDAQAALRRIIEAYSRTTRFILICNYVTRIIEPLASRCAKFRFQSLPPASMKQRLQDIAQSEGIPTATRLLDPILDLSKGDMRRAVTLLQSAHLAQVKDAKELAELAGLPPPAVVDDLYKSLFGVDVASVCSFDGMRKAVQEVCWNGYSVPFVLQELTNKVCDSSSSTANNDDVIALSDLGKAQLVIRIAEAEKNLQDGADEYLQLMTVCSVALQCRRREELQQKQASNQ